MLSHLIHLSCVCTIVHILCSSVLKCCALTKWFTNIVQLASCPWGPATAHWVGILTKWYVIYMKKCSSHCDIARCFGLGFFGNLAPRHQQWHTANSGKPSYKKSLSFYKVPHLTLTGPDQTHT